MSSEADTREGQQRRRRGYNNGGSQDYRNEHAETRNGDGPRINQRTFFSNIEEVVPKQAASYNSFSGATGPSMSMDDWDAPDKPKHDEYEYAKQFQEQEQKHLEENIRKERIGGHPSGHGHRDQENRRGGVRRGGPRGRRGRGGFHQNRAYDRRTQQEGNVYEGSMADPSEAPSSRGNRAVKRNEFLDATAGIVPMTSDDGLVINSVKTEFLQALETHQVVIVEGFTGCGKTTKIPQFILDSCENPKIVVTQPRRIAAISVAERVCKMRGWKVGETVGYQVGMDRQHNDATRLVYMTTGVLLQVLINRKSLSDFQYIIIDEVHERDLDTDLLLLVVKKLMMNFLDTSLKIILMSATLNADKFRNYFPNCSSKDGRSSAAIVKVPDAPTYRVEELYINKLPVKEEQEPDIGLFDEPKIHELVYQRAVDTIVNLDDLEKSRDESDIRSPNAEKGTIRGAVLVFLPGLQEIETMYKYLFDYVQNLKSDENSVDVLKWHILPLHSTITSEEQQKVFRTPPAGMRKIILATNIAESSITVSDIRYVIDFCLTKSLGCDPHTNYTCLRLEWASKNQCTQRRGRCGRVADGVVYRMVPKLFYERLMQEAPPEMDKASLESVVLHVKTLGFGTPKELLALAVDPPPISGIRRAVANLKEVGALTLDVLVEVNGERFVTRDDCNGDLTYMGCIMASLPIDMRLGRLILISHLFGLTEEAVIIAAGLSTKSPFSHPYHRRLQAYLSKLHWAQGASSDLISLISAYRNWRAKFGPDIIQVKGGLTESGWAKQYMIQKNVIKEIHNMVEEISRRLESNGIIIPVAEYSDLDDEKRLLLKVAIAGAFYPNYFTRKVDGTVTEYHRSITKELNGKDPFNTVVYYGFPNDLRAELYTKHILTHFEDSERWPVVPYVDPQSTKFFLSFDPRGNKVGLISHGVYRAVKMRQQRMSISFLAKPRYQADELYEKFRHLQLIEGVSTFKCPDQVELPRLNEKTVEVRVMHVENPGEFYVIRESNWADIDLLDMELRAAKNFPAAAEENTKPGDLVVTMFGDPNSNHKDWLRSRVDVCTKDYCIVSFIDHRGGIHYMEWGEVKRIPKDTCPSCYEIPGLAMHCRLKGVVPAEKCDGVWSKSATKKMSQMLNPDSPRVLEVYSVVNGVINCDVIANGVSVTEDLLKAGLVVPGTESSESDNNNRERVLGHILSKGDAVKEHFEEAQKSKYVPGPVCVPPRSRPNERDCKEITLKGPTSPLEMRFRSISKSAWLKDIAIDGSSVNSVCLDQDFMNPIVRLLVAGTVGIAQRSGNVMARETTLMPPIPGLPTLLTMMFCPTLEWRCDEKFTRYTGLVAGLGFETSKDGTAAPVYQDHDVEIINEIEITDDDIKEVNEIRSYMDMMLKVDRPQEISNCQLALRQFVIRFLLKKRTVLAEDEMEWPNCEHKWNCYPSHIATKLKHEDCGADPENPMIFKRHHHLPLV